jgi:hypothetical protein
MKTIEQYAESIFRKWLNVIPEGQTKAGNPHKPGTFFLKDWLTYVRKDEAADFENKEFAKRRAVNAWRLQKILNEVDPNILPVLCFGYQGCPLTLEEVKAASQQTEVNDDLEKLEDALSFLRYHDKGYSDKILNKESK